MIISNQSPWDCLLSMEFYKDCVGTDDLLREFPRIYQGGYIYRGLVQRGAFCSARRRNVRFTITDIVSA